MRCLYIVAHHPLSPNYRGGGSAIYHDQLLALRALRHEIDLWIYFTPRTRAAFDAFIEQDRATYDHVVGECRSVTLTVFPEQVGYADRLRARAMGWIAGEPVANALYRTRGREELDRLIARFSPDVIWAHHLGPAQMAVLQHQVPVIYVHHDWVSKVRALARNGDVSEAHERCERRVARAAAAVVSGSATECEQLRTLGCARVVHIPVTYGEVAWSPPCHAPVPARVVHLGGLQTTANRVGLERFLDVVWPALAQPRPELWVIGDLDGAGAGLSRRLQDATCTGFVPALSTVLRPFDVHVIPWEHDTGTRTRLPLAFAYGQTVVAVRAAVAGSPEARDGENCRLVSRLDEMPAALEALLASPAERERLGRAARRTYVAELARDVLLCRYEEALAAATRPGALDFSRTA